MAVSVTGPRAVNELGGPVIRGRWTLVNRGEPIRSWITVINIRDHRGQPAWYSNEKNTFQDVPGWSRWLHSDPGSLLVLSLCYPGAKYRGDPGRDTRVSNISKLFLSVPDHLGVTRFNSWVTQVHPGLASGVFRSRWDGPTVQCDWGIRSRPCSQPGRARANCDLSINKAALIVEL